jgi:hypothetical protein
VAVNASGGITTTQTSFPLVNTTATTVNFGGWATTITAGNATTVNVQIGGSTMRGNVSAGNIIIGSNISAGNILASGNISASSIALTSAITAATATATGNVTALNFITTGTFGNITGANVITANTVVGNNNKSGAGIETPYAAAADIKLLSDGWPLLDAKQTQEWPIKPSPYANLDKLDNYDDETGFYRVAERFLAESKPPVGDFIISVNGSLNPVIGSYNPGDWCSVIINDEFVKTRLNSVLEPRKDVLVRKIDSISVSVPNNPAFPEQINLQLTTNWQVDEIGK